MKISIHLVTWNGAAYMPYLFASLKNQTYKDWELLVIDNASTDATVSTIEHLLTNFSVASRVIVNKKNIGFAGAHNQAIRETKGEYVLMLNQDMYLTPDCLEKLANFLDNTPGVAVVAPRLMRWDFKKIPAIGLEKSFTNDIDALGLKIFRSRRAVEQYTGQKWEAVAPLVGSDKSALPVFGVSGAFPVFRRTALNAVCFSDGTVFDESYFMYKEDLDLAYRLASAGFKSALVLGAVAYHDRTGAGPRELGDGAALKNKQHHNRTVRFYSYKNHLATLYKNEYWQNLLLDFFPIFWYELKKFVYFLFFDRATLAGLVELWRGRMSLKTKRRKIKKIKMISWQEMRQWWK